jgi:hypothetical protein
MLNLTELIGFAAGGVPATVEYVNSYVDTGNLSAYSFAASSLGAEGGARKIIVAVCGDGGAAGRTFTAVTVAGIAATQVVQNSVTARVSSLWIADVPTGTTGTIDVTCSAGFNNCRIGVYAARNLGSMTPVSTASDSGTDAAFSVNLTGAGPGFAVGASQEANSVDTVAWSGLTEDFDLATEGSKSSGARSDFTSGGSKTISGTWSSAAEHSAVSAFFS